MTADSFLRVCLLQIRNGNRTWVEALRDKALARLNAGGGQISVMETGSANGKSFGRRTLMDCVDVADICQSALDESAQAADDDVANVSATGLDFSGLNSFD